MRKLLGLLVSLMVLHAAAIGPAAALDAQDARHLLTRTGFGAEIAQVAALGPLGRDAAVDRVLAATRTTPSVPPPAFLSGEWPNYRDMYALPQEQRDLFNQARRAEIQELKTWWLVEMIATPAPLTERMTLFWHNHFVSAFEASGHNTHRMWNQNDLFRRESTGNFGTLLRAILSDPIMLRYLDASTNRKGRPNENLARELLELFTLGEGHYAETDIKEIARALTGLGVDRETHWDFRFYPGLHDTAPKSFLGAAGQDVNDVVRVLLAHPRTALYVAEKLWREFVSPQPDPAEVARIAGVLRGAGYDLKPALRALFLSDAFWDWRNRGSLIKAPVVLIAGLHRELGLPLVDPGALAVHARRLGQDLFEPPNVKGWPGGETWITPASLVARNDVLGRLLDNRGLVAAPLPTGTEGLAIRVAGEAWQGPPRMRVTINDGTLLAERDIDFAVDTSRFGRITDRNEWTWRVLRFPVDQPVRRVVIRYLNDGAAPMPKDGGPRGDRNLFIDWIEVAGRVYPSSQATQRFDNPACKGRGGELYCNGDLTFDLASLDSTADGAADANAGSMAGMMGSGMAMGGGAGRPALPPRKVNADAAAWIATLPGAWQRRDDRWRALMPIAPVSAAGAADDEAGLRALILDPAYQLM
jgi:uncharacterized protein (DUF1800 family)